MSLNIFLLILVIIWLLGFLATFSLHAIFLQMVSFELAIIRSLLWPVWLLTGWPNGTPMGID